MPISKKYRILILVRHGQYEDQPEKLSKLGIRQALKTAKALESRKANKIITSTMPRALETARILGNHLGIEPIRKTFLVEGVLPGSRSYRDNAKGDLRLKIISSRKKVKEAFSFMFQRPIRKSSCEIVVAHGNVIRHWVCMALGLDGDKNWGKIDVMHTSITTFRIDELGNLVLMSLAETGHLPKAIRTFV